MIKREKEIEEMLNVYNLDILYLVETDTKMILEEKDYKVKGYRTVFQNKKVGNEKTRIVALCKEGGDGEEKRGDLCSNDFPSIWIEVTDNYNK